MTATHNKLTTTKQEESLKIWNNKNPQNTQLKNNPINSHIDFLNLSEEAKKMLLQNKNEPQKTNDTKEIILEMNEKDKNTVLLIEKFLEQLTGEKIKLTVPEKIEIKDDKTLLECEKNTLEIIEKSEGWGIEYEYHETHSESEELSFLAEGEIHTDKGEVINFSLKMNMNRSFFSKKDFIFRAGDAKKVDPLTINLNGNIPELTNTKFRFDLDADGKIDEVSFVKPGSGFLALDENKDGIINDGSELFGPTSGNGFIELAEYDEDENGWIDKNDSIYDNLKIWTKNSDGKDHLLALGKADIGAIYLGHISTPFEMKNDNNLLNGVVQKTGIYVNNNHTVGTIQQIDLTV